MILASVLDLQKLFRVIMMLTIKLNLEGLYDEELSIKRDECGYIWGREEESSWDYYRSWEEVVWDDNSNP